MWGDALKGSSFCFARGAGDGFSQFRPCFDDVLFPAIFAIYISVWVLYDAGFFTKRFWARFGKSLQRGMKKALNFCLFFCSCCLKKKTKESDSISDPSTAQSDSSRVLLQPESSKVESNANFIDPSCGCCDKCLANEFCPMKTWTELNSLSKWLTPYRLLAVTAGLIAGLFSVGVVLLPGNSAPNTDANDDALKEIISVVPEVHLTIHMLCQMIISFGSSTLTWGKMNKIPSGKMTPPVVAAYLIHLTCFYGLLVALLIPSMVSIVDSWTSLSATSDRIPISLFWTVIMFAVWLLLIMGFIAAVLTCLRFVKAKKSFAAQPREIQMAQFGRRETGNLSAANLSKMMSVMDPVTPLVRDGTWVNDTDALVTGCGCGCCSDTGAFRISRNAPESKATWVSRFTFGWMSPFIALGYSRPLDMGDLTPVPSYMASDLVEERFSELWKKEVEKKGESASFIRVCFRFSKVALWQSGICKLLYDTLSFSGPLILNILTRFLTKCNWALYDPAKTEERTSVGWLFLEGIGAVALMCVSNLVMTFILHQYFHIQMKTGISLRAAIVGFIYSKSLRISSGATAMPALTSEEQAADTAATELLSAKEKSKKAKAAAKTAKSKEATTTGEVVNLMSVDAQRLQEVMPYIHLLWSSPYVIIIALVLLWLQLGPSMLAGVAVMAISIPLSAFIAKHIKSCQRQLMLLRDERIKITNEVFSGIKIIKVYAWEESFQKKVVGIRETELKGLWKYSMLNMAQRILWTGVPAVVSLVTFLTYVAVGNTLDAATAFTSISLFNILRFPLNAFPMMISLVTEAHVACSRIQNFVIRPEVAELPPPPAEAMTTNTQPTIVAKNLSLRWPNKTPVIDGASFECKPGTVTAIIGKTGAGKTGLLAAVIGDLIGEDVSFETQEPSSLTVTGRLAYVAQTAWIVNATVRSNILFGRPFNAKWYANVIRACALKSDLEILPGGDLTEIGEKGVNLSGGQKQRVSLARAVYQCGNFPSNSPDDLPADIYVLDDCLSAVDSHVGQHIFEHCIMGLLREAKRTVVFVTHKVDILSKVDNIIFISREPLKGMAADQTVGRIIAQGKHEKLMAIPSYVNFTTEAKSQEVEEEEQVLSEVRSDSFDIANSISFMDKEASEDPGARSIDPSNSFARRASVQSTRRLSKGESVAELALQFKNNQDGKKAQGLLTDTENLEQGAVGADVYWAYFDGVGGPVVIALICISLALSQGSQVASNVWLSHWSDNADTVPGLPTGILVYSALALVQILLYVITAYSVIVASQRASRYFHSVLIASLLRAPMSFFDSTPLGRIINRFSKDLYTIDQTLPQTMNMYITNLFTVVATFLVIIVATPWFAAICVPLLWLYASVQSYYIPGSRQLQRVDSVLRSPIFAHFSETLDGVPTIRAYRAQRRFKVMNTAKLDSQQRAYYLLVASNRWLAVRLETVGTLVVTFASLLGVFGGLGGSISPGVGALAITYALNITQSLNWMVRMASDRESNIVSVERVQEYSQRIPSEAPAVIESHRPAADWPATGTIQFEEYKLRYRPKLPLVLKSLKIHIKPKEKIGIVGRTGAGKSTLLIGLLRLIESAGGKIIVDGVDISEIGLFDLRSKFSIIPQDPILFTGNLRFNLDPFDLYTDAEVWQALERSHLKPFVSNDFAGGLMGNVEEGGKNLSMGQKQLICLARALLRQSKILLLDEATSAVDPLTDRLIQQTIRDHFSECTILTIAHRLATIMDYDKILVLDAGVAVEYDSPQELLKLPNGFFRSLCVDSGLAEKP